MKEIKLFEKGDCVQNVSEDGVIAPVVSSATNAKVITTLYFIMNELPNQQKKKGRRRQQSQKQSPKKRLQLQIRNIQVSQLL